MNIGIIGRSELLYNTAEFLIDKGHTIKLIITAKEAPEYTKTSDDFERLANKVGAEYLFTNKIDEQDRINFIKSIGSLDAGISVNYVNVISQEVIDIFNYGILNAHGGDLPKYKGNACQAWAIINGEEKIGLCIHKMIGGEMDSGDIITKDYLNININTKIADTHNWMYNRIPELFLESLSKLEKDKDYFLGKPSDKPEDTLRCYPRFPEDGKIDWKQSSIEILRLINASGNPYSGAFCKFRGEYLIIWDAEIYEDDEKYCATPGQVSHVDKKNGYIVVITGNGKLRVNEIGYCNFKGNPGEIINSIRNRLS